MLDFQNSGHSKTCTLTAEPHKYMFSDEMKRFHYCSDTLHRPLHSCRLLAIVGETSDCIMHMQILTILQGAKLYVPDGEIWRN
jgi:hypothetical protein